MDDKNPPVSHSTVAEFWSLGAIIHSFTVDGVNIVQNFPTDDNYLRYNVPYFGETIGRVANRIGNAQIHNLNGRDYKLNANNGPNCLHGGTHGWGKQSWKAHEVTELSQDPDRRLVQMKHRSEDGDEGFPGTIDATVTYSQGVEIGLNGERVSVLDIEYEAELMNGANETAVSMTNHSYFNLVGANTTESIEKTIVLLSTEMHLPVDENLIPTGTIEPFPGGFAASTFELGAKEPAIDHCFIVNDEPSTIPTDTRDQDLKKLASFYHPDSKIHLEVLSTEPAFQFYTGEYIDVPAVGPIPARGRRAGFCVEPSRYINAVNVDGWRGMVILRKGENKYGSRTVYRAWKSTKADGSHG